MYRCAVALALLLGACQDAGDDDADRFAAAEQEFRDRFDATPVAVSGVVLAADGTPLAGAAVTLSAADGDGPFDAVTDGAGTFVFEGLLRRNRLLTVTAGGYRSHVQVAMLLVPLEVPRVELDAVVLDPVEPGVTRFFFAGDVALGRRFLDSDDSTPRGQMPPPDPDAIISTADPLPGTRSVFAHVAPLLATADYPVVNLESPVTDMPATPHPTKEFVFFSLPGSLPALREVGIRYVSLGNNHMYDYLEAGVADTRQHLDEVGLPYSGAGANADEAFTPHVELLNGTEYAFVSATSIAGEAHAISYVATDDKGGAADLRDTTRLRARISEAQTAGIEPIVLMHTGIEYGQKPVTTPGNRFDTVLETGAKLIVGHHPHVAQGIRVDAGALVFHSLGNFAFDQARQETMLGLTTLVDMRGGEPMTAYALPVYLEDYRPRLIGGRLFERELRRLGELSPSAVLYPFGGRGWIDLAGNAHASDDRVVELDVTIGDKGTGIVDLRGLAAGDESLVEVSAPSVDVVRTGHDLMLHGDMEDYDADAELLEAARWDITPGSLSVCMRAPHRGVAALCSVRSSSNSSDSVLAYRNRVRVIGDAEGTPNKDLTLLGYMKLDNAGRIEIVARYYASTGDRTFGEQVAYYTAGGDQDWSEFWTDLSMPADDPAADPTSDTAHARAVRLFLHQMPPGSGAGEASYDDLAIISWDPGSLDGALLPDTNSVEFLRLQGAPGTHHVQLKLRRLRPAAAGQGSPSGRDR